MAEGLELAVTRPSDDVVLVLLSGELDIASCEYYRRRLAEVERDVPARLVVDLAGLTFIDSSGINALVQTVRTAEARGGNAVLASPSRAASRVFDIARLDQVVKIEQDRGHALADGREALADGAP